MTDQVSANDDPEENRRQRTFDRRYRLLELRERRADRAAKAQEVEINRALTSEVPSAGGIGLKVAAEKSETRRSASETNN